MTGIPVSVVVVSRGRPDLLKRCLTGLSQLQYDPFEIVVVADPEGMAAARTLPFADALKQVVFDQPNISAARNLGIVEAAGDVVAFIDDDAVPEPQWLRHLAAPFARAEVAAAGGFVRGRNGISFQWRAQSLDPLGWAHPLDVDAARASVMHPPKGRAIKTEGTNMAVRRSVLVDLGGFDPAFAYFLDETDLNMRLGRAGHATAIVPLAEVHHGYAANAQRDAHRVPRDLFEIGASWAVFQRKHVPETERRAQWQEIRQAERRRLIGHMVQGGLEPRAVRRLMGRLEEGYAAGKLRSMPPRGLAAHPASAFRPFPAPRRRSVLLRSRPLFLKRDLNAAARRAEQGEIVTLLSLSPTSFFHTVAFDPRGVWVQRGGLWGRSERHEPLFRMTTRSRRAQKEKMRVARQRGFEED